LAGLLDQVVEGKLPATDALKLVEQWSGFGSERRDVNAALLTLLHFHVHRDLRKRDPEYDEALKHSLRLHISTLRTA